MNNMWKKRLPPCNNIIYIMLLSHYKKIFPPINLSLVFFLNDKIFNVILHTCIPIFFTSVNQNSLKHAMCDPFQHRFTKHHKLGIFLWLFQLTLLPKKNYLFQLTSGQGFNYCSFILHWYQAAYLTRAKFHVSWK